MERARGPCATSISKGGRRRTKHGNRINGETSPPHRGRGLRYGAGFRAGVLGLCNAQRPPSDAHRILHDVPRFLWPGLAKIALQRAYVADEVIAVLIGSISFNDLRRAVGHHVPLHFRELHKVKPSRFELRLRAERAFKSKSTA